MKLLRAMRLDPVELRGVGIQITKLDGENKAAGREPGQGMLPFGGNRNPPSVSAAPQGGVPVTEVEQDDEPLGPASPAWPEGSGYDTPGSAEAAREDASPTAVSPATPEAASLAGPSRLPGPSSEGIDPDFLAALPPDLRLEVKREFALTRNAGGDVSRDNEIPTNQPDDSPTKTKGMHEAAHITRQLRPKLKTQLKAAAIAELPLYSAWSRGKDTEAIDIREDLDDTLIGHFKSSELRKLGIDVAVFSELPAEMQEEIVIEERRRDAKRQKLHRPADTSRQRARERERQSRTTSLSPTRSRGGSVGPALPNRPPIALNRPPKPALMKATSLPDVLRTITKWIESRGASAPAARDAGQVRKYLLKCVEEFAGIEVVLEVLKWMKVLLEERFPDLEQGAASKWWAVWEGFVADTNEASTSRFGAELRI